MPTKSINMHGKLYKLSDETIRTQAAAKAKAAKLRKQGKVAFLNPVKRKGKLTKYYVYEAPKGKRKVPTKRKAPIKRKALVKKDKLPTKSIDMHGQIYGLKDGIPRTQIQAQALAAKLRKEGKIAFLNPRKRKGQKTVYFVYQGVKAIRKRKVPVKRKAPAKRKSRVGKIVPTRRSGKGKVVASIKVKVPTKRKPGRPRKKLTQAQKTAAYKKAVKKTMEIKKKAPTKLKQDNRYLIGAPWLRSGRKGGWQQETVIASNQVEARKIYMKKHKLKRMPYGHSIEKY